MANFFFCSNQVFAIAQIIVLIVYNFNSLFDSFSILSLRPNILYEGIILTNKRGKTDFYKTKLLKSMIFGMQGNELQI